MGNSGREKASGGNSGILEGGHGMAGGGHCQLMTKRVKLLSEIVVAEMVCRQGVRLRKRHISCPLHGTGLRDIPKGNVGNTVRRPQHTAAVTARRHGGRSGMVDLAAHFMPRQQYRGAGRWTWHMRQEGRKMTGGKTTLLAWTGKCSPTRG